MSGNQNRQNQSWLLYTCMYIVCMNVQRVYLLSFDYIFDTSLVNLEHHYKIKLNIHVLIKVRMKTTSR